MTGKKALVIGVTVLGAAALGYFGFREYHNNSEQKQHQQQRIIASLQQEIAGIEERVEHMTENATEKARKRLENDGKFRDFVVRQAVSNNPNYVLALIPENARTAYVNSNYTLLTDELKKQVAIQYVKDGMANTRQSASAFVGRMYSDFKQAGSDIMDTAGKKVGELVDKGVELVK